MARYMVAPPVGEGPEVEARFFRALAARALASLVNLNLVDESQALFRLGMSQLEFRRHRRRAALNGFKK